MADSDSTHQKNRATPRTKRPLPRRRKKAVVDNPSADTETAADIDPEALARGDVPMDMVGHLDELRTRLIKVVITLAVCVIGSFILSDHILAFLTRPYTSTGLKLHVFSVTEGFVIRLKAALIVGVVVALPLIIHQLWRYIMPAVATEDRRFARVSIFSAVVSFFAGAAFTFLVVLPISIRFLLNLTPTGMQNVQNASEYIGFVLMFSVGIGAIFEFPLVVLILTKIGIITPQFLISKRKLAIVLIWVTAAVFTPPDILSQILMALPLMFLYELAIIISRFVVIRKKRRELYGD